LNIYNEDETGALLFKSQEARMWWVPWKIPRIQWIGRSREKEASRCCLTVS